MMSTFIKRLRNKRLVIKKTTIVKLSPRCLNKISLIELTELVSKFIYYHLKNLPLQSLQAFDLHYI